MLLAASGLASLLTVLIVLACPLMMIFMMRGMHGGHGAAGRHGGASDAHPDHSQKTLDELKHERDLLNEEIGQRAEETVHANRRGARAR